MPSEPYVPLSARRGLASYDKAPYEGVPPHLLAAIQEWVMGSLGEWVIDHPDRPWDGGDPDENRRTLALQARLPVVNQAYARAAALLADEKYGRTDQFLDIVDRHLHFYGGGWHQLDRILEEGGSAWTVVSTPTWSDAPDSEYPEVVYDAPPCRLERRVSQEQRDQFEATTAADDDAAEQLREAWGNAYGVDPDASDAWDHAIKAVEIALHPIVSPGNEKATLGSMLSALEAKPGNWTVTLQSSSKKVGAVEALTGMLRLMWPNPDRHGSGTGRYRDPTPHEAEQIVGLAVLVVSWLRKNALQPAAPPLTGPSASP